MSRVKGTSVMATADFVRSRFGDEGFDRWLAALSPEAREIFGQPIFATTRYPMDEGLRESTEKVCQLFFDGDVQAGAVQLGRHSADQALTSFLRIFVRLGSPHFLIKRTAKVFSTYYEDAELLVEATEDRQVIALLSRFPAISDAVEWRFVGYFQRALEISGCREISVLMTDRMSQGAAGTRFVASWG